MDAQRDATDAGGYYGLDDSTKRRKSRGEIWMEIRNANADRRGEGSEAGGEGDDGVRVWGG